MFQDLTLLYSMTLLYSNVRSSLGLDRFSLRGQKKVSIQWRLYCVVHNLLKVHRYGFGFAGS